MDGALSCNYKGVLKYFYRHVLVGRVHRNEYFFHRLQDLVRRALDVEPSRRPTAAQVLSHPWMTAKDLADTRLTHDNPSLMKVSEHLEGPVQFLLHMCR